MSEQLHAQPSSTTSSQTEEAPALQAPQSQDLDLDGVLDGIDEVLEVNALEFVQGFRQQGGQ